MRIRIARRPHDQHVNGSLHVPSASSKLTAIMRRLAVSCSLLMIATLLGGCWDRTELNDTAIALATAIDAGPNESITVTIDYPIPAKLGKAGSGNEKPYTFIQSTGVSFRDAVSKGQNRMSRKLNISHRRVLVIGEEMAKRGLRPVFDEITRLSGSRLNGIVVIARGTGSDVLHGVTPIDEYAWEGLREFGKSRGRSLIEIKNVAESLSSQTNDPIILYMGVEDNKDGGEKSSKQIKYLGYAQFRSDKMIGIFKDQQVSGIRWLNGHFIPYELKASLLPGQTITLNIMEGRSTFRPRILSGNKVRFDLEVKAVCSVSGNYGLLELDDMKNIKELSIEISKVIQQSIESAFAQMQEQKTDSIGFGNRVFRKYPR
ncbi:MAG: Ger(x)C family spore germination protein, partial [Gorillibacterium sp.]|nr:Ger(x)C family spore germination protein [Gorillibacterium sp.]